jgi:hypothetical protein
MRHIVIVAKSLDLTTRAVLTEKKLVLAKKPDGNSERHYETGWVAHPFGFGGWATLMGKYNAGLSLKH